MKNSINKIIISFVWLINPYLPFFSECFLSLKQNAEPTNNEYVDETKDTWITTKI